MLNKLIILCIIILVAVVFVNKKPVAKKSSKPATKEISVKDMSVADIEKYLMGEWSDDSCYMSFYTDKTFRMSKKSDYNSEVSELRGKFDLVDTKAIILYIEEGRYKGETVYPDRLSAGAKILEINPVKNELYIKCYIGDADFIVARLTKK